MTEKLTSTIIASEISAVLVVEDEKGLADLYTVWLADLYAVKTAYDGEESLDELDGNIDVVLLDRRMPGLPADDVLEHIQNEGLDIRVGMVSAVTPDFAVINMGFDEYLTQPVDPDDLHDVVERLLRRAEYDETLQEAQQLVATKAALEAERSDAELRANDKYATPQERIEKVQTGTDTLGEELTNEDFEAVVRALDADTFERSSSGGRT